jgi:hypothetical protein
VIGNARPGAIANSQKAENELPQKGPRILVRGGLLDFEDVVAPVDRGFGYHVDWTAPVPVQDGGRAPAWSGWVRSGLPRALLPSAGLQLFRVFVARWSGLGEFGIKSRSSLHKHARVCRKSMTLG